jgi:hypothetical protein
MVLPAVCSLAAERNALYYISTEIIDIPSAPKLCWLFAQAGAQVGCRPFRSGQTPLGYPGARAGGCQWRCRRFLAKGRERHRDASERRIRRVTDSLLRA